MRTLFTTLSSTANGPSKVATSIPSNNELSAGKAHCRTKGSRGQLKSRVAYKTLVEWQCLDMLIVKKVINFFSEECLLLRGVLYRGEDCT